MCGINWYVIKDTTSVSKMMDAMNQRINHRGPDDSGYWSDQHVALGQVRLSILDLSEAGHNPMFYGKEHGACSERYHPEHIKDSSVCITFNGEVYNYVELREALITEWYVFTTGTDTEVVIASYLHRWSDCVQQFNGMWALCIYDLEAKTLFFSRDRLGIKPLHYYHDGSSFIFSSEIKWILAVDDPTLNTASNLNSDAISMFFDLGFVPAPHTIFNNIYKLEARQNLLYDLKTQTFNKRYYYDFPDYIPEYDKKKLLEEWRALLQDAVKLRMRSDVPVWAFLSGGLDSSAVVGEMKSLTDASNLHTFSIWFEWTYDESEYIHIAKDYFWTNHHHYAFTEKDAFEKIEQYSKVFDEPYADFGFLPALKVSELAHDHIKVVLTGDGGDEVFGGYSSYPVVVLYEMAQKVPIRIRKVLLSCVQIIKKTSDYTLLWKIREFLRFSLYATTETLYFDLFPDKKVRSGYGLSYYAEKRKLFLDKPSYNLVEVERAYNLFYSTLSDNYLVKVDRATMEYGLEWRTPFLDWRLIEYSFRIPTEWKVTPRVTKKFMRELVKDIVPPEIVNLKKKGFTPPFYNYLFDPKNRSELTSTIQESLDTAVLPTQLQVQLTTALRDPADSNNHSMLLKGYLFSKWQQERLQQE